MALTRREWEGVARDRHAAFVNVEITCSDPAEHRRRVAQRASTIPTLRLPTWQQVLSREYDPWDGTQIAVDTAGRASRPLSPTRAQRSAAGPRDRAGGTQAAVDPEP